MNFPLVLDTPALRLNPAQPSASGWRQKPLVFVAVSWGLCAYFPIGLMYVNMLLMMLALAFAPDFGMRWRRARTSPVAFPIALMVSWTVLIAAIGDWLPDTGTRLFHVIRVALVLLMGIMLTSKEARLALIGFLTGSLIAMLIVLLHHLWGLPDWAIWSSLLSLKNNFSSGNMITMAMASSLFFWFGLRPGISQFERGLMLAGGCALALTVVLHSESRNSQLLLSVSWCTAVACRYRSPRAAFVGLLVVCSAAVMAWSLSPSIQKRFLDIGDSLVMARSEGNYVSSVGVRLRMYEEATQGMLDHPLTGVGVGSWLPNWRRAWSGLQQQVPPDVNTRFAEINNPHNDFLLAGMETGVPGMVILVWLFWRFVHGAWRARSTQSGVTLIMGVALVVTAMVNAPLRDAALGMTLLWLLGVSLALRGPPYGRLAKLRESDSHV